MPAFPEFGNRFTEIRTVEILHELVAHHLRRTERDIRIAGKITVNLKSEKHGRHDQRNAFVGLRLIINFVDKRGETVSDDYLFEKPPDHQLKSGDHAIVFKIMFFFKLP